jgi:hypothetical protein
MEPEPMNAMPAARTPDAVEGCLESCRRCEAVIAAVLEQDPGAYPSVGAHLRHCLEHYQLLLEGWRSGDVDYDARARDEKIERDPQAARGILAEIARALASIEAADLARAVRVTQSAAPGRPSVGSPSHLERELIFLSSHTIHHIAIMVLSARVAGIVVPGDLGVAYSTEAHRTSLTAAG